MIKKCVTSLFNESLSDSLFVTERRSSTSRSAHEAELDDVLGAIDLLDNKDMLKTVTFAAVDMSRLPGYGPEEINVCAIAAHQSDIAARQSSIDSDMSTVMHTVAQIEKNVEEIRNSVNSMVHNATKSSAPPHTNQSREQNIIVFGISESSEWRKKLTDVLNYTAGREIVVQDAFRIGRSAPGKHRPIIVKLHSIWDRRLLLSNSRQLASCDDYMNNVYLAADESLEERRKKTINRMYKNARRDRKDAEMADDGAKLFIEGALVYTLKDGFV